MGCPGMAVAMGAEDRCGPTCGGTGCQEGNQHHAGEPLRMPVSGARPHQRTIDGCGLGDNGTGGRADRRSGGQAVIEGSHCEAVKPPKQSRGLTHGPTGLLRSLRSLAMTLPSARPSRSGLFFLTDRRRRPGHVPGALPPCERLGIGPEAEPVQRVELADDQHDL